MRDGAMRHRGARFPSTAPSRPGRNAHGDKFASDQALRLEDVGSPAGEIFEEIVEHREFYGNRWQIAGIQP